MSSEAKLGLLAGIAAVLLIAVVSYRKPQLPSAPPGVIPAPKSAPLPPPAVSLPQRAPALASDPLLRTTAE